MKTCSKCGKEKSDDKFYKKKAQCKDCLNEYKRTGGVGWKEEKRDTGQRVCECGAREEDGVDFKTRNRCRECSRKVVREWRKNNKQTVRENTQKWKNENRERYKEQCRKHYSTPDGKAKHKARVEKTPRTWLSHLLGRIKASSKKPGPHDPKGDDPRREYNLDLGYVVGLYEKQNGKCALTGLQMVHKHNNFFAASMDRIDPQKGHIKGNIQIVCQAINWAKRHNTNEDMAKFLDQYFRNRLSVLVESRDASTSIAAISLLRINNHDIKEDGESNEEADDSRD